VSARTTASAPIAAAMAVSDESPETAGHAEGISSAFHATTPSSGSSATLRTSVRQLTGDEPFKLALKAPSFSRNRDERDPARRPRASNQKIVTIPLVSALSVRSVINRQPVRNRMSSEGYDCAQSCVSGASAMLLHLGVSSFLRKSILRFRRVYTVNDANSIQITPSVTC